MYSCNKSKQLMSQTSDCQAMCCADKILSLIHDFFSCCLPSFLLIEGGGGELKSSLISPIEHPHCPPPWEWGEGNPPPPSPSPGQRRQRVVPKKELAPRSQTLKEVKVFSKGSRKAEVIHCGRGVPGSVKLGQQQVHSTVSLGSLLPSRGWTVFWGETKAN